MTDTRDAYHGQGGSYVVNKQTQERELVERTKTADEVAAEKAASEAPPIEAIEDETE